ncbi:MAG: MAPEG family protein, partial [Alphaproteobacteria bacterium]|nr:MAPEG family protein [Alphaproteobacteria bacterium]
MNNILLTSIFASLFTIFYLFLSFRIGYLRGSPVMKLIFKMDKEVPAIKLDRNVRAHGNFSEYVPLFLILIYIFESLNLVSFNY